MTGQDRAHWLRLKKSKWIIMAVKRYPWTEPGTASGFKRWICEDKTALYLDINGDARPLFRTPMAVAGHINRYASQIRDVSDIFDAWFGNTTKELRDMENDKV